MPPETPDAGLSGDPSPVLADRFEARGQAVLEALSLELPDADSRLVAVTSAELGAGVTTLTWAIARTAARSAPRPVLYVDAHTDVHRGPDAESPARGFVDLLVGRAELDQAVARRGPKLHAMAAGGQPGGARFDIAEADIDRAVADLRKIYSYVFFDAAPPTRSPFSLTLARHLDGALLVVALGASERDAVRRAAERARAAGVRLLGVVLNDPSGLSG